MEFEIWKDIPGYEGYYQASTLGRIRSLDRTIIDATGNQRRYKGNVLRLSDAGKGYLNVMLSKNGKRATPRVNRVIAMTFLDNPNGYTQVNHKDENKANNRADNLEWCTPQYNTNYGTGIHRRTQHIKRPVLQFDLKGNLVKGWASISEASGETGIDNSHITRCCKGKLKKTGGFVWKYAIGG